MAFKEEYSKITELVEQRLSAYFNGPGLEEAMKYSLMAGGKRIRPALTIMFCEAAGGSKEEALTFACGVEMLHTYSLIHDDLPCMDDDDLRRGRPTCHKVYGECVATLAGDALQTAAFSAVLSDTGSWESKARAAQVLAEAAGHKGMCAGQYDDTAANGTVNTVEALTNINRNKTGALLKASCVMGVLASMGRREVADSLIKAAEEYADNLGLAFQIKDDILDVTSTEEELGKPIGSDAQQEKSTFVSVLGIESCRELVRSYTEKAISALDKAQWSGDVSLLRELAVYLMERNY